MEIRYIKKTDMYVILKEREQSKNPDFSSPSHLLFFGIFLLVGVFFLFFFFASSDNGSSDIAF
jgi:hypothetical protein